MADFRNFLQNNSSALLQSGIGLLGGRTAQEQAAMGLQGFAQARQANKTLQFLRQTNPDLAQAVESGAITPTDAYKMYYEQKLEAQKPKKPNLMGAGGSIYNADTGEWLTPPKSAADGTEYGLNPIYGVDDKGNPVILQTSKSGTVGRAELPAGVTLSKEPIRLDAGTQYILIDPITRQQIGTVPKDLAGAEAQKAQGQAQGEARSALSGARNMASMIDGQIQSLKTDPYLPSMLGPVDSRTPDITSDAARVKGKMDQLSGNAFLQARQMLKGGGAITDFESQKAEAAFARLNRAQRVEDYIAALDEFNAAVQQGVAKLESQAGGQNTQPVASPGPRKTSTGVQWSIE